MSSTFDRTGMRLITGEVSWHRTADRSSLLTHLQADKTIKVWKPDETATEETHPLDWKPTLGRQKF